MGHKGLGQLRATLGAGDYFGERSLESVAPAVASATAATACALVRVDRGAFDRLLGHAALQAWSNTLSAAKTARGVAVSAWKQRAMDKKSNKMEAAPVFDFERGDCDLSVRDFLVSRKAIGSGGFGKVHLCRNKLSGKYFALKHMEKAAIVRLNQVHQILSESHTLSQVLHPFIANK